ncbi:hypothetical protein OUY22_13380 [Nonomuraea sp. MCN248]|uniref:DUF5666 domain-containing protein n=1 Tax=Nonomuraea corallina TaxID=2989783 RepID=A0ABT4SBS5_9ACTN|nr:hypothetical protein [Nonomuraea corallina]MDA0634410.1 hypothetical protein [Nonomuraea corallina]
MTTGPDGFDAAQSAKKESPRRRFPRSLLLAAATGLVVVTGGGVATAAVLSTPPSATPTPTATTSATPTDTPSEDRSEGESDRKDRRGWGGPLMGFGLHGEFVVPGEDGAYLTLATQYGEVTAVGQDSVTVKSEDGYTREYAVNADTRINRDAKIDALKTGQKVGVRATVEGGTATAVAIRDLTEFAERGPHGPHDKPEKGEKRGPHGHDHNHGHDDGRDQAPATPAPTS